MRQAQIGADRRSVARGTGPQEMVESRGVEPPPGSTQPVAAPRPAPAPPAPATAGATTLCIGTGGRGVAHPADSTEQANAEVRYGGWILPDRFRVTAAVLRAIADRPADALSLAVLVVVAATAIQLALWLAWGGGP